jgi:hypothetical protein
MSSNFQHGVEVMGYPNFGGFIPPITGTYFHVCPGNATITNSLGQQVVGLAGNDGLSIDTPLDSINTAYGKCTSGAGDGIIVWSYGTTTAACTSYLTSGISWTKHGITVVGVCSGSYYNQRARVSQKSTSTMYYLLDITGYNNAFYNLSFVNGSDLSDAQICAVKMRGDRNYFYNCDFKGTPATMSAYQCDLWFSGAHENTFVNCNLGNASLDRANNAGAFIYLDGTTGNAQNLFEHCIGVAQVSTGTAYGGIKSGAATALNGAMFLRNCDFSAWQANANVPSMASFFIGTKFTTGNITARHCSITGWAAWDSVAANNLVNIVGATDAATAGVGAQP